MVDFEKVRMGHERWTAQWPAVPVRKQACALAGDTTAARANRARAWGRGPSFAAGPSQTPLCCALSPV